MEQNNNISQERLEQIERYLNSQMQENEQLEFESELVSDAQLKLQVEDFKAILLGVETSVLKEKLEHFHQEIPKTLIEDTAPSKVRTFSWQKLAIAASLIIAVGSFWFLNQSSLAEQLFTDYFKPDPGLPTTMSTTNNFEFYDAMVNYKQGDYKTAIKKWKVLQQKQTTNDTLNYFLGVAHLANNNDDEAIKYLNAAKETNSSSFKSDIYYYLGLAHLKSNNIDEAKSNFKQSSIDNSKNILDKLIN